MTVTLERKEKETIVQDYGKNAQDTGSTEVQIALLSKDIDQLTEHCQQHQKDFSSRRGLIHKVNQRKRLLHYLERTNEQGYKELINKLGLRK